MKRLLVALIALPFMLACGNDSTSPGVSLAGTWDLRTVNGTTLPYTVSNSSGTQSITNSVLTLSSDGSYNEVTTITTNNGFGTSTQPHTETGTWSANQGYITFFDETDGGLTYNGSVSGTTLTETYTDPYTNTNFISVYSRR